MSGPPGVKALPPGPLHGTLELEEAGDRMVGGPPGEPLEERVARREVGDDSEQHHLQVPVAAAPPVRLPDVLDGGLGPGGRSGEAGPDRRRRWQRRANAAAAETLQDAVRDDRAVPGLQDDGDGNGDGPGPSPFRTFGRTSFLR